MKEKVRKSYLGTFILVLGVILIIIGIVFGNTNTIREQSVKEIIASDINNMSVAGIEEIENVDGLPNGKVIVKYTDREGNVVAPNDEYEDTIGKEYNIARKEIEGYMEDGSDPINKIGNYMKEDTVVTFICKSAENMAKVDTDNKKVTIQMLNGKQVAEYAFKIITKSDTGNVLKNAGYSVTDKDGKVIKQGVSAGDNFIVGMLTINEEGTDTYKIKQTNFPNRHRGIIADDIELKVVKELNAETNTYNVRLEYNTVNGLNAYIESNQIIVEINNEEIEYGKLIVKYLDEKGTEISGQEIKEGEIGTDYELQEKGKDITGYTFKEVTGEIKGKYTNKEAIVTYTYTKNKEELPKEEPKDDKPKDEEPPKEEPKDDKPNIEEPPKEEPKEEDKKIFDLEINKSINKVIIKDKKSEIKKPKKKDSILKVDIPAKRLKYTTIQIEYDITVKNVGEIEGYAKKITDYVPKDFKYVESKGTKWSVVGKNIVTEDLANILLKPGDTKTLKATFEWKLTENNIGPKDNSAKITKYYNKEGLKDNTPDNEDKSTIIVSVKTGAISYTLTILGTLLVLGAILIIVKNKNNKNN